MKEDLYLVTGASGFLGSYVVRDLIAAGKKVRAIKRSTSTIPSLLKNLTIEWVDVDITDVIGLEESMQEVTHVFHCAAYVSIASKNRKKMERINVEGTANVVNLCMYLGIKKMVHVSSVAAIGWNKEGGAIDEKCAWEMDSLKSVYSITKYQAEQEVWRGIAEGLNAVIVNPSVIIGAFDNWYRGSGRLFSKTHEGMNFYTTGGTGFVDVQDVSKVMLTLMESDIKSERFVLNGANLSFKEVFTKIAAGFGKPAPKNEVKPWMLEMTWRLNAFWSMITGTKAFLTKSTARSASTTDYYSTKKIEQQIGYTFTPIDESIARICKEYLNHLTLEK